MKYFLLLLIIILAVNLYTTTISEKLQADQNHQERFHGYEVIVIDSCEYIRGHYRLAHKGNCRFCVERRRKELAE